MSDDISNKTILILVVLTVIVSTLGTLTVLESAANANAAPVPVGNTQVSSGHITLKIASPPPTGQVTLSIIDNTGESYGNN